MVTEKNNRWNFDHSYAQLPSDFFSTQLPTPVSAPQTFLYNDALGQELGLGFLSEKEIVQYLSGNALPPNSKPIAQAYAGHQFGHFTMLGDGRAILLGEIISTSGKRFDVQLKGAGPTPYSRRGDGRATLYSMLREFIISEAMHHLGIPCSRSLAVVATGDPVFRESVQPGAVLTRIMSSHLRIGTFEFARRFTTLDNYQTFFTYTLRRHYPHLIGEPRAALLFLKEVMQRQIDLVVQWMRVGFIHGVLNTDNISIAGETFDFGPCAFMNTYHPKTVFSSIDTQGRYAFDQQAGIIYWNLGVLAGALLPLIDEDENKAIEKAKEALHPFEQMFHEAWLKMMFDKSGIINPSQEDVKLILELIHIMETAKLDYTDTFQSLIHHAGLSVLPDAHHPLATWINKWTSRLENTDKVLSMACMQKSNPVFIPRNHWVEKVLADAVQGNRQPMDELLNIIRNPYETRTTSPYFEDTPENFDVTYRTFCGT